MHLSLGNLNLFRKLLEIWAIITLFIAHLVAFFYILFLPLWELLKVMAIWKNVCTFYKTQIFSICGSMSHVMKVNHNYHFLSAYSVLRFKLRTSQLLSLMFTIMLREGHRKQTLKETVCRRFTCQRLRGAGPGRQRNWSKTQNCNGGLG